MLYVSCPYSQYIANVSNRATLKGLRPQFGTFFGQNILGRAVSNVKKYFDYVNSLVNHRPSEFKSTIIQQ